MSTSHSSDNSKKLGRPTDEGKRQAIIEAASDAFFEHGFAATSIEGVAAAANVSKVTLYNHFGDKRGLFVAAVGRECEKMREHFSLDGIGQGSLRDRLSIIGTSMVTFLARPEMVQFERRIAAETEHEPAIGKAFLAAGPHRMKESFAALISAYVDAGELSVDNAELAAEQFVSMCKGMGDLDRRFGHYDEPGMAERRIQGAVDLFLCAYGADTSFRSKTGEPA